MKTMVTLRDEGFFKVRFLHSFLVALSARRGGVVFLTSNLCPVFLCTKIQHIGVSEIAASALRRAAAVAPVVAVEIEVSLWSMEDETWKVLKACDELNIAVIAYS
jgi:hypothetical protein